MFVHILITIFQNDGLTILLRTLKPCNNHNVKTHVCVHVTRVLMTFDTTKLYREKEQ